MDINCRYLLLCVVGILCTWQVSRVRFHSNPVLWTHLFTVNLVRGLHAVLYSVSSRIPRSQDREARWGTSIPQLSYRKYVGQPKGYRHLTPLQQCLSRRRLPAFKYLNYYHSPWIVMTMPILSTWRWSKGLSEHFPRQKNAPRCVLVSRAHIFEIPHRFPSTRNLEGYDQNRSYRFVVLFPLSPPVLIVMRTVFLLHTALLFSAARAQTYSIPSTWNVS